MLYYLHDNKLNPESWRKPSSVSNGLPTLLVLFFGFPLAVDRPTVAENERNQNKKNESPFKMYSMLVHESHLTAPFNRNGSIALARWLRLGEWAPHLHSDPAANGSRAESQLSEHLLVVAVWIYSSPCSAVRSCSPLFIELVALIFSKLFFRRI